MSKKALIPVEQKQVLFYDDKITAIRLKDGRVVVPVKPICERLGVQWAAQSKRIRRDPVLSEETMSVSVMDTDIRASGSRRPYKSKMLCLPLDFISGFLFGIHATRVKEELREHVIRYQRECYKVLAESFQEGRLTTDMSSTEISFDELLSTDSEAVQAYKMALAVVKLARNQVVLESQLQAHSSTLVQYGERLEELEAAIAQPDSMVTQEQASQISQAVKAIAIELGKQTKRNEFGGVYGELYRKFGITSYKMLPAKKFEVAMAWMNEWHGTLTGSEPF